MSNDEFAPTLVSAFESVFIRVHLWLKLRSRVCVVQLTIAAGCFRNWMKVVMAGVRILFFR